MFLFFFHFISHFLFFQSYANAHVALSLSRPCLEPSKSSHKRSEVLCAPANLWFDPSSPAPVSLGLMLDYERNQDEYQIGVALPPFDVDVAQDDDDDDLRLTPPQPSYRKYFETINSRRSSTKTLLGEKNGRRRHNAKTLAMQI